MRSRESERIRFSINGDRELPFLFAKPFSSAKFASLPLVWVEVPFGELALRRCSFSEGKGVLELLLDIFVSGELGVLDFFRVGIVSELRCDGGKGLPLPAGTFACCFESVVFVDAAVALADENDLHICRALGGEVRNGMLAFWESIVVLCIT